MMLKESPPNRPRGHLPITATVELGDSRRTPEWQHLLCLAEIWSLELQPAVNVWPRAPRQQNGKLGRGPGKVQGSQ